MTQDEIVALVARLDPAAEVTFTADNRARVMAGPGLTGDGLDELLRTVPDAQVGFGADSPLWLYMLDAMRTSPPRDPVYELDDLNEYGTWKPGRKPEGWGKLT